ncbi:TonB-dependent receptor domain-containing protein, partial [Candidatus Eisenbacteria bacterium]
PDIIFEIDKKVINVGKQLTAASGTAVDVLENVPSVTVDIEGNVTLRGSSSFTVLLDGRPTLLEPSEVLEQIPASTIETIEIITNPSARYDPDGVTGIINVVSKKQKMSGISGVVNLNAGLNEKYGGDFLFNYRRAGLTAYIGADYGKRVFEGETKSERRTYQDTLTSIIRSEGTSDWRRSSYGLKGGLGIDLTESDLLSTELRWGGRSMERGGDEDFDEWLEPGGAHNKYVSTSSSEWGGDSYSGSVDYRHSYGESDHELTGQVFVSRRDGDEEALNERRDLDGKTVSGQRSTEEGPSRQLRTKLDYVRPFNSSGKIEAGYQSRTERTDDGSELFEYNPETGEYEFQEKYSNTSEYGRDIYSLYSIYSGNESALGYQAGLRTEYTYRTTKLVDRDTSSTLQRWDFFPTLHLSYKVSDSHQTTVSYTRRIQRPRNWYLDPFITWRDAYTVSKGNPALKPEYIDSYEMGYQADIAASMLSVEAYYRLTHNTIERVQSVYEKDVILQTVENVGKDYTLGVELLLNINEIKWWAITLMGDLYDYRVKGTIYDEPFSRQSFNWSFRYSNMFKLTGSTRLQITGRYRGPTVTAQGTREGSFMTDGALRQDFMNRKLSLNLQVRDLLGTGEFEFESEGPDFYSYRKFTRESPVVTLTVSYNFNNYKPDRRQDREMDDFEDEGGEF